MVFSRPATGVRSLILIVLSFAFLSSVSAQDLTGSLEGRVVHDEGAVVSGVEVQATGPQLQGTRATHTDNLGFFRFPMLPVGTYRVRLSHPSFGQTVVENVSVSLGRATTLGEITLTLVAPGAMQSPQYLRRVQAD